MEISLRKIALMAVLLLAACAKNTVETDPDAINFYAGIGALQTKTVYGGESIENGELVQAIHWLSTDQIRVWGDLARTKADEPVCDYHVDSISTADSRIAKMEMRNTVALRGLRWKNETVRHNFVSVCPSPAVSTDVTMDENDGTVTVVLPSVPTLTWDATGFIGIEDMQYAYLYARSLGVKPRDSVPMLFKPAFTAFEFVISCGDFDGVMLNKFTLECTAASANGVVGKITIPATGELVGYSETVASITVNMDDKTLSGSQTLDITVFAFPKDLTNLKITYEGTYESNTFKKSLTFIDHHGDPTVFRGISAYESGRKYRIKGLAFRRQELEGSGEDITWDRAVDILAIGPALSWQSDTDLSATAEVIDWVNGVLLGTGEDMNWIISHQGAEGEDVTWEDDTEDFEKS